MGRELAAGRVLGDEQKPGIAGAQAFSAYYHDNPVLHNEDANLVVSRIALARGVLQTLRNGMGLIGVPFLERM